MSPAVQRTLPPEAYAGSAYDTLVCVEESLRQSMRRHVEWMRQALEEQVAAAYGHRIAQGQEGAIVAEASARVAAMAQRIAGDLARNAPLS